MAIKMKVDKCPSCGGVVLKLAGKASKLCHKECMDCRKSKDADEAALAALKSGEA